MVSSGFYFLNFLKELQLSNTDTHDKNGFDKSLQLFDVHLENDTANAANAAPHSPSTLISGFHECLQLMPKYS